MATFTVTTPVNIDSLTGKTGGDVYNINGGTLTIDQDSRFGLNNANTSATAATTMGSITISATLGGVVNINATNVWLIPFSTGSGTMTAGATLTLGAVTCKVIGIYSTIATAPVLTGVATGFIKVKQVAGGTLPSSGTFTQGGYTFTITGAATKGWIGLEGDEAATITVPRLGAFNIIGDWFEVGTTSGVRTTTYQLPTNGTNCYMPMVQVETAPGSGVYENYHNAGSVTALVANVATDATRGECFWATVATGLLRFGHDGTNSTGGYLPVAGCKIRIPNVICNNTTTTARNAVALPNATLATRYDFTTTGGGVVNIDKAALNWYPSFAQAYSVALTNTGVAEQISISEIAAPLNWSNVTVGQSAAQAQFALLMSLCFAGGTFTNCLWTSATLATAGRYVNSLTDISGFTFANDICKGLVLRANATTGTITATRALDCTWTNPILIGGQVLLTTCTNNTFTNVAYVDTPAATTGTANPMSVIQAGSNCLNIKLDGLTLPIALNQPYTAIVSLAAAGCTNTYIRNIGTRASPLNLGATNGTGLILSLANGAAALNVKVQRVYTSTTRTNIFTGDNSSKGIVFENVAGDFADAPVVAMLNTYLKAVAATPAVTAQTAVYGSHWFDCFTSATAGRIGLFMNEQTADTAGVYTLSNGAAFTSAGGLYMPTIGQIAEFVTPYFILGHTGFQNLAATMGGGTIGNYTLEYDINKGAGFTNVFKVLNGANLSAETGISITTGIKLKIRITTAVTNTTAITSLYVTTNSSTAAQDVQYPLEVNTTTFTGLPIGTDTVVLTAGTTTILEQSDSISTTSYTFTYSGNPTIDIGFICPGYRIKYIRNLPLATGSSSIPVELQQDLSYV